MTETKVVWGLGCVLEGHRGWRITADALMLALDAGWTPSTIGTAELRAVLLTYVDSDDTQQTIEAGQIISELDDEALAYLTEHFAPENASFGWHDGELMLWSSESWEEI